MRIILNAFDLIMRAFSAILLSPIACHLPRLSPFIYRMHKTLVSVAGLPVLIHIVERSMRLAVQA